MDDLTYPEHGAAAGSLPEGYHHLERQVLLGAGTEVLERAAEALVSWRMHRAAGLTVTADGDARPGLRVVCRLPPGITAPCQVVYMDR